MLNFFYRIRSRSTLIQNSDVFNLQGRLIAGTYVKPLGGKIYIFEGGGGGYYKGESKKVKIASKGS